MLALNILCKNIREIVDILFYLRTKYVSLHKVYDYFSVTWVQSYNVHIDAIIWCFLGLNMLTINMNTTVDEFLRELIRDINNNHFNKRI